MGVYGILAGIAATGREFSQGHYGHGSLFLSQTVHSVGSMTGINNQISKISKKVVQDGLKSTATALGLEKTLEKFSERILASSAGRFMSVVPYVSVVFDIAFVGMDVDDIIQQPARADIHST